MRYGFRFQDLLRHVFIIGATASGKTSAMLRMIHQIMSPQVQQAHPSSVILLDPHGDAAFDLAKSYPDLSKVVILDPHYVSFGLNPLELTNYRDQEDRRRQITTRIGELKTYLADVMRSDPERASRLTWIFTGNLHYLYSKGDSPTFRDLYFLVSDESWMDKQDIKAMLVGGGLDDKTIEKTLEGILTLRGEAFPPLLNRLARFVLPSDSIVARTFCARKSTLNVQEWLEPGRITIVRIPKIHDIPEDFRELLAASVVLAIYFAVQARASRLEEEGRDPSARTPVFLFIDEFQTIERLQTLEVILSEARKFGLSLVLANQYTSQLSNRSLLDAVVQNAGIVMVGSVSGEDEKFFSRIMGDDFARAISENTTGMFVLRIRPYEFGTSARSERWFVSKPPDPVRSQDEVIEYMRTEMQRRYGGAVEDKTVIYRLSLGEDLERAGKPKMSPLRWTILLYLRENSANEYMRTDDRMVEYIVKKHEWKTSQINRALNELMELGYISARTDYMSVIVKGRDRETGQLIYGPPTTQEEKERARVVIYTLTKQAIDEFFTIKVHGARAGSPMHLLAMKKLIEKFWSYGYWCVYDSGEFRRQRPDILVFKRDMREKYSDVWDYDYVTAVEIELNPRKHRDQVRENYEKNVRDRVKPIFYVLMEEQREEIHRILSDKELGSYEVRVLEEMGFTRDRVAELEKELEAEMGRKEEVVVSAAPQGEQSGGALQNPKWEEEFLAYWRSHGMPVISPDYKRKLMLNPRWKEDPIWKRAEQEPEEVKEPVKEAEEVEEIPEPSEQSDEEAMDETPMENVVEQGIEPTKIDEVQEEEETEKENGEQEEIIPQTEQLQQAETEQEGATREAEEKTEETRTNENTKKNIIKILLMIHNKINTSKEIAEKLGVSRRQVLRYIDVLKKDELILEEKRKYFLTASGVGLLEKLRRT